MTGEKVVSKDNQKIIDNIVDYLGKMLDKAIGEAKTNAKDQIEHWLNLVLGRAFDDALENGKLTDYLELDKQQMELLSDSYLQSYKQLKSAVRQSSVFDICMASKWEKRGLYNSIYAFDEQQLSIFKQSINRFLSKALKSNKIATKINVLQHTLRKKDNSITSDRDIIPRIKDAYAFFLDKYTGQITESNINKGSIPKTDETRNLYHKNINVVRMCYHSPELQQLKRAVLAALVIKSAGANLKGQLKKATKLFDRCMNKHCVDEDSKTQAIKVTAAIKNELPLSISQILEYQRGINELKDSNNFKKVINIFEKNKKLLEDVDNKEKWEPLVNDLIEDQINLCLRGLKIHDDKSDKNTDKLVTALIGLSRKIKQNKHLLDSTLKKLSTLHSLEYKFDTLKKFNSELDLALSNKISEYTKKVADVEKIEEFSEVIKIFKENKKLLGYVNARCEKLELENNGWQEKLNTLQTDQINLCLRGLELYSKKSHANSKEKKDVVHLVNALANNKAHIILNDASLKKTLKQLPMLRSLEKKLAKNDELKKFNGSLDLEVSEQLIGYKQKLNDVKKPKNFNEVIELFEKNKELLPLVDNKDKKELLINQFSLCLHGLKIYNNKQRTGIEEDTLVPQESKAYQLFDALTQTLLKTPFNEHRFDITLKLLPMLRSAAAKLDEFGENKKDKKFVKSTHRVEQLLVQHRLNGPSFADRYYNPERVTGSTYSRIISLSTTLSGVWKNTYNHSNGNTNWARIANVTNLLPVSLIAMREIIHYGIDQGINKYDGFCKRIFGKKYGAIVSYPVDFGLSGLKAVTEFASFFPIVGSRLLAAPANIAFSLTSWAITGVRNLVSRKPISVNSTTNTQSEKESLIKKVVKITINTNEKNNNNSTANTKLEEEQKQINNDNIVKVANENQEEKENSNQNGNDNLINNTKPKEKEIKLPENPSSTKIVNKALKITSRLYARDKNNSKTNEDLEQSQRTINEEQTENLDDFLQSVEDEIEQNKGKNFDDAINKDLEIDKILQEANNVIEFSEKKETSSEKITFGT